MIVTTRRLCLLVAAFTLTLGVNCAANQLDKEAAKDGKGDDRFVPPALPFFAPIDEQVLTLAFSPDGKELVTAGARHVQPGQIKVWEVPTGREILALRGVPGVRSITWSPDGTTLASGDFSGSVRLRDADTGAERAVVKGHKLGVNAVAYSPDGKMLVSAGLDHLVKLWDASDLQLRKEFTGHEGMVLSALFFKHGQAFVTAGKDGTARIWDVATGKEKHILRGHKQGVEAVAISPNDKLVATASWDKTIKLWDAENGTEKGKLEGHTAGVLAVAFSPDGKWLASAGFDQMIRLWDVEKQKSLGTLGRHNNVVWALAFARDGMLASGSSDTSALLWNVAEKKAVAVLPTSDRKPIRTLAYSPDGKLVAIAKLDKTVQVWDAQTGDLLHILRGHTGRVRCLAFAAKGDTLASGSSDKTVKLWDPISGKCRHTSPARPGAVTALAFSADGKKFAVGSDDGSVQCCSPETGNELEMLKPGAGLVRALAFAADGRLAVGGDDAVIKVLDSGQKGIFDSLVGHAGSVRALAFSPDGLLASGSDGGQAKLWERGKDKALFTVQGHEGPAQALAFSPSGQRLYSGGADGIIRAWDPRTGKAAGLLQRHTGPVTALAMHPAGADLLSGSHDMLVLRWPSAASSLPALPVIFRHDFRGTALNKDFLKYTTKQSPPKWMVQEADGLRISPPEVVPRSGPAGVMTTFRLRGDFDIIASYEILQAQNFIGGGSIGVSLYLTTESDTLDAVMLSRFNRKDGSHYVCTGKMTTPPGQKRQFPPGRLVATDIVAGHLRLVRQEKTVRFLVADEGADGFQELHRVNLGDEDVLYVRLAVDPGTKESPPVIGRLRSLEVRGQQAPTQPAPPQPPPALAPLVTPMKRDYAKEIYQDFRGRKPLVDELKFVGPDHDNLCKLEDAGMRITLPAQRPDKNPVGVRLQFPLAGDFEITATYEFLSSEAASGNGSWPVGVALNLSVANNYSKPFAKIGRFLLAEKGHSFVAESWNKEKSKQQIWREHPAPARSGKVRLVRDGATLSFQVADGPGDDFREIHKEEFSAEDVALVRFAATGHPVNVDARLIDLKIRYGAAGPVNTGAEPGPQPAAAKEEGDQRVTAYLPALLVILCCVIALVFGGVGLMLFIRRGRAAPTAPGPKRGEAATSFACASCGKMLKVKAQLAGKKVKCPKCGKAVVVPLEEADEA